MEPSDGRAHLLQADEDVSSDGGAPPTFLRSPYERPARAALLLCFLCLAAYDFLPFYFNLDAKVWEYEGSYYSPIGVAGALLSIIFVLVAVAGGRAQTHAMRSCPILLQPQNLIHVMNVLVLAAVIPWWLHERSARKDVGVSDLFDGWGYISGKATKQMMGLCLLPIARQSQWLNAAAAGFPEAIAFHRATGWWCIGQVVIHMIAYTVVECMDAVSDYESWKQQQHSNQTSHGDFAQETSGQMATGEFQGSKWNAAWRALEVSVWNME